MRLRNETRASYCWEHISRLLKAHTLMIRDVQVQKPCAASLRVYVPGPFRGSSANAVPQPQKFVHRKQPPQQTSGGWHTAGAATQSHADAAAAQSRWSSQNTKKSPGATPSPQSPGALNLAASSSLPSAPARSSSSNSRTDLSDAGGDRRNFRGSSSNSSSGGKVARNRHAYGRQHHSLQAAPSSELSCEHFASCSGCSLENDLGRPPLLARARATFRALNLQGPFALDMGPVHRWRCRAKLAVRLGSQARPCIGLFREGTHDIVPIPRCRIHHPRINQAVELVAQMAAQLGIPICREGDGDARGRGTLRYLQLTAVARGGAAGLRAEDDDMAQVQLVLVWGAADERDASYAHCQRLWQALWTYGGGGTAGLAVAGGRAAPAPLLHSIWVNLQPPGSNAILGPGWRYCCGPRDVWQQFGMAPVCLAPGSFVQANFGAMQLALSHLLSHIPVGTRLVELHAGVGAIGLAAAATGRLRSLRCVEVNPSCAAPFEASCAHLDPALPVEFVVAAAGSAPAAFIAGADVLVVDPPRKGLEPELLAELTGSTALHSTCTVSDSTSSTHADANVDVGVQTSPPIELFLSDSSPGGGGAANGNHANSSNSSRAGSSNVGAGGVKQGGGSGTAAAGPHTLVYLSCGFTALERDLAALLGSKLWHLHSARALAFFPGTDSLETLVVLKRAH